MSKASEARDEKARHVEYLRRYLRPGKEVYTHIETVSRSGMQRTVQVYVVIDGKIQWLTGRVACAIDARWTDNGLVVGGCGFDAGFDVVMRLSYALHGMTSKGDGALPENAGIPFQARPGHFKAGYSLRHERL